MTPLENHPIYTIGHSNHSMEWFLSLLRTHEVTAIADVRSSPFSRLHPAFNRDALREKLRSADIQYVFLGRALGGRSSDPSCYANGRVRYDRVAATTDFKSGLERVMNGSREHRVALLCAEAEPLACHRGILIARELEAAGFPVWHIHRDGSLESHSKATDRLLTLLGMAPVDLFRTHAEVIADAYTVQEQRIAYVTDGKRTERAEVA